MELKLAEFDAGQSTSISHSTRRTLDQGFNEDGCPLGCPLNRVFADKADNKLRLEDVGGGN